MNTDYTGWPTAAAGLGEFYLKWFICMSRTLCKILLDEM
uniref:Uncharacterized protein n=1 Tax=Romanomermis culicivorax TaxID=13658 RepID=A0A915L1S6_ROMCU